LGEFWLGGLAKCVIWGGFHGFVGAKASGRRIRSGIGNVQIDDTLLAARSIGQRFYNRVSIGHLTGLESLRQHRRRCARLPGMFWPRKEGLDTFGMALVAICR
jgi:hypothetical protein